MRLARAAVLLGLAACANVQAPPGGPEDKLAPRLLATRPDTNAALQGWTGPVVFVFDEELAEQGVEDAVSLSPVRGRVAVDKEGDQIVVRPRAGWERGQIYQAEVAAGIKDRFGNARTEPIRLVFSTGPAIPDTRASGAVVERITGSPGQQTRVDAVRVRDSLTYTTRTDSAGRFEFRQVPEGEYRVIAYRDANRNGRPDPFEARDTARLTFATGQAPTARLATLLPDTTPPVVRSATLTEGWVEVRTDDYLDPEQPLSPAQVAVVGPDSVPVPIAEVRVGAPPAARPDSADADADSAAPAARPGAARPAERADSAGAAAAPPR
ncbi:MAG: Ig-like domain-containing protein, partial [Gemmatimonadetes bacterium]|nr:Ig-like domain-containing protein [Gemmatimonadota bacterium]